MIPASYRRELAALLWTTHLRRCLMVNMRETDYDAAISEMKAMRERVRSIRTRYCEPKSNTNPRYLALSNVVSNLSKAIEDMEAE